MRFPDGTKIQILGLDEIMEELCSEGRQPNQETAEELLDRLGKNNNYIPSSARREYKSVLLKEYREFVKDKKIKLDRVCP
ncbi:MAG: hypothetical protein FJ106_06810 [Deltaproteobacteria bacterium]|nr:hypothetical protein [Deltaproteobacteria bacterium]